MSAELTTAAPDARGAARVRDRLDLFAVIVLTILCAVWGTQQVMIKIAGHDGLPPAMQAGMRSAGAATFLFIWVALRGNLRELCRIDSSLGPGLLTGAIFAVEFLLLYFGLERTTASHGVLFLFTSPFFVAIGVHFYVPEERLALRQMLGLLCAFAGIAIAVFDGLHGLGGTFTGDVMVVGTAILWAAQTVLAKGSPSLSRCSAEKILFYNLAGSAPLMLLVGLLMGQGPAMLHATQLAYLLLFFQTFVVAFVSYLIWYWLIKRYPAGKLAAFSFLTPLFGIAAGGWILSEPISGALIVSLFFVVGGLYLVNSARTTIKKGQGSALNPQGAEAP